MTHKMPYTSLSNKLFFYFLYPLISTLQNIFFVLCAGWPHTVMPWRLVQEKSLPAASHAADGAGGALFAPEFCQAGLSHERNHRIQLLPAGKTGDGAKLIRTWQGLMLVYCCLLPVWMKDGFGVTEMILLRCFWSCTPAVQDTTVLTQKCHDWFGCWFQNQTIL